MSFIFQNGSRTQSYGPGEKMPALPQQPKASFGKPPGSSQENYLTKQPAGQAQSTPQPSQGTPYSAYAPNSSSSFATNTDGVNRTYNTNAYNNASSGNFANNPASRPPPFTQGATGLGGQRFSDPSQAFVQRDAMIDRLNTNKSQYTANAGVYQGDGPPPASFGQQPQYDFNSLMGQANDMVQQGWTNPFSQPAGGQSQAGDAISPYAITLPADHPLAGRGNPSDNNYGKGFGPGVPILKGPGMLTSSPVTPGWRPGSAQPIAPQQPPSGYYPGGPGGFPAQPVRPANLTRMPYAGGMDYEQGPPVVRPGLYLRPPQRRAGMAGYQTNRRL